VAVAVFLLAHRGRRVAITAALAPTWLPLEPCASAVAGPKPKRSTSPFCSQRMESGVGTEGGARAVARQWALRGGTG